MRPSAEKILAETEKGRRTDSPERVKFYWGEDKINQTNSPDSVKFSNSSIKSSAKTGNIQTLRPLGKTKKDRQTDSPDRLKYYYGEDNNMRAYCDVKVSDQSTKSDTRNVNARRQSQWNTPIKMVFKNSTLEPSVQKTKTRGSQEHVKFSSPIVQAPTG